MPFIRIVHVHIQNFLNPNNAIRVAKELLAHESRLYLISDCKGPQSITQCKFQTFSLMQTSYSQFK
jgi:hypothetical protein